MNAPVSAISFSRDSTLLASGDQAGNLILWDVSATEVALARASFPEPVRWIGFPRDGGGLLAATDEWLHALQRDGERLTIVATRMLASGAVGASDFVSTGPRAVRLIAASAAGGPASQAFDLEPGAARPGGPMPDALPERDWAGILGLELDGATGIVRPVMK
jgi:WD40 repeat protein